MTDCFDRAQKLELDEWEARQAAAIRAVPPYTSLEGCAVCGDPIPEARRQAIAGCRTCIDCQTYLERLWTPKC